MRKTANLHTGGRIIDVTDVHPTPPSSTPPRQSGARGPIGIPVTGIDFIVKSPSEGAYTFVDATSGRALRNTNPSPRRSGSSTFLFPLTTAAEGARLREGL